MSINSNKHILISGAGIGGLVTAIALSRSGFTVQLFEQANQLKSIGAGIQLSPNAWRILEGLGLSSFLKPVVTFPDKIYLHNHKGRLISSLPLGSKCINRFGAPYAVVHRGDLQQVLLERLIKIHGVSVETGTPITNAFSRKTSAIAETGNGETLETPLIIAADGVHSRIREKAFGLAKGGNTGKTAWRAMLEAKYVNDNRLHRSVNVWLASGHHAISYPVSAGNAINLIIIAPHNTHEQKQGKPDLGVFPLNTPQSTLFEAAKTWHAWPIMEMPQPYTLAKGRIALLGDAAHAMRPFAAQGGAMAIEDAAVIAQCIATHGANETALKTYAEKRLSRLHNMAGFSRQNGIIYQLPKPFSTLRDIGIRFVPASRLLERQAWIYRWCI